MTSRNTKGGDLHRLTVCGVSRFVRAYCSVDLDGKVLLIRKMAANGSHAREIAKACGLNSPDTYGARKIAKYIRKNHMVWNRDRSTNYPGSHEAITGVPYRARSFS